MRDFKNLGDMEEPVNFFKAVFWASVVGAMLYGLAWLLML